MMRFTLLPLCLCVSVFSSYAQTSDSLAYFPCAVGNKWEWVSYSDNSRITIEITRDSIGSDGTKFLFINGETIPRYSIDTLHHVYQFLNSIDTLGHMSAGPPFLLFKLDAQEGDSFYTNNNNTLIRVSIYPSVVFGHVVTIKQFTWYGQPGGSWFLTGSLAWGFGRIAVEGPFSEAVIGCRIDGINYGSLLSIRESNPPLPTVLRLEQNYPNPFNPTTTIRYALPVRSRVRLAVFNPLAQQVAILIDGEVDAGYHEVTFDASSLASGVYFYRLQTGDFVQTLKLCLIR